MNCSLCTVKLVVFLQLQPPALESCLYFIKLYKYHSVSEGALPRVESDLARQLGHPPLAAGTGRGYPPSSPVYRFTKL